MKMVFSAMLLVLGTSSATSAVPSLPPPGPPPPMPPVWPGWGVQSSPTSSISRIPTVYVGAAGSSAMQGLSRCPSGQAGCVMNAVVKPPTGMLVGGAHRGVFTAPSVAAGGKCVSTTPGCVRQPAASRQPNPIGTTEVANQVSFTQATATSPAVNALVASTNQLGFPGMGQKTLTAWGDADGDGFLDVAVLTSAGGGGCCPQPFPLPFVHCRALPLALA